MDDEGIEADRDSWCIRSEGVFLNKYKFRTWFQDLIPNFGIKSSWNWFLLEQGTYIHSSSRNRVGNRVARLTDEKSVPCLKINILWSMGNPFPNPILRINSTVQICLEIPPLSRKSCQYTIFQDSVHWISWTVCICLNSLVIHFAGSSIYNSFIYGPKYILQINTTYHLRNCPQGQQGPPLGRWCASGKRPKQQFPHFKGTVFWDSVFEVNRYLLQAAGARQVDGLKLQF